MAAIPKTAKVFKYGAGQAVRLPDEFRVEGGEVIIKRAAGGILLLPRKLTYEQVMTAVGRFKGGLRRKQPKGQKRQWQRSGSWIPIS